MSQSFNVAWITGASSGMGRALALFLARQGIKVYATARNEDALKQAAAQNANLHPLPGDVTDSDSMKAALATIRQADGLPDLVVLNAATYTRTLTNTITLDAAQRHFNTNVFGVLNATTQLLPLMKENGRGRIVIVGSVAGYRGLPNSGIYGATKAALISYAESLRAELATSGITVQIVNPGFVETPMTAQNDFPMPFIISAEEAASRIWNGLQKENFEITFPKRASYGLKFLRLLPYGLYFRIAQRMIRQKK